LARILLGIAFIAICSAATAGTDTNNVLWLCDFETPEDVKASCVFDKNVKWELTAEHAASGKSALKMVIPPATDRPNQGVSIKLGPQTRDWTSYKFLLVRIANPTKIQPAVNVNFASPGGRLDGYWLPAMWAGRDVWLVLDLGRYSEDVDLANMESVLITASRLKEQWTCIIDAVGLVKDPQPFVGRSIAAEVDPQRADSLTFEQAFKDNLLSFYHPDLVDKITGLPYEVFSITERKPFTEHPNHRSIGGDDATEEHLPYMIYYIATGDKEIGDIERKVARGFSEYLDPGDGMVGCYRWDFIDKKLGPFWGWCASPSGKSYCFSDAEHGSEVAAQTVLPAAWYLHDQAALQTLERYSRTLLKLNSDPKYLHFHLFVGRDQEGKHLVYDWNGQTALEGKGALAANGYNGVTDPARGYSDILEFAWIMPMLGTAHLTRDAELRRAIINRVQPIVDNVIDFITPDGKIPWRLKMDGSLGDRPKDAGSYMYGSGNDTSYFIRALYAMHALTGDDCYKDALDAYWENEPDRLDPQEMSLLVFHAKYFKTKEWDGKIKRCIALWEQGKSGKKIRTLPWARIMALATVATGDKSYLAKALEWEKGWRRTNYRKIGGFYYYFDKDENNYVDAMAYRDVKSYGWFMSDHFRGYISDLVLIKDRGDATWGLTYWNLLILGWMVPGLEAPIEKKADGKDAVSGQ